MKIEYININEVRLNPDNPRTITKENQEKLINSLLVFPRMLEIRPIVIDDNNIVLGGNQRTEALNAISKMETTTIRERLNGLNDFQRMSDTKQTQVLSFWSEWKQSAPVIKASELTEEEKKQFIIKDNAPFGEWDWNALESWDAESLEDWGLEVPEDWGEQQYNTPKDVSDKLNKIYKLEIECIDEQQLQEIYDELTERGLTCRVLTL